MNDEWNPSGWLHGVKVLRPDPIYFLDPYADEAKETETRNKEYVDLVTLGNDVVERVLVHDDEKPRSAEEAFYARMEREAEVSALKAQISREMEARRKELEQAALYDDNPEYGAF